MVPVKMNDDKGDELSLLIYLLLLLEFYRLTYVYLVYFQVVFNRTVTLKEDKDKN